MARHHDRVLDHLVALPWQVGTVLAPAVYLGLKHLPSRLLAPGTIATVWTSMLESVAPFAAGLVLLAATLSFFRSRHRARLLDSQSGIDSIRRLSWVEFEQLIGEYHRRLGYAVMETGRGGADGGVDLRMSRGGEFYLVQCKHWKAWKVGVPVVREMLGTVVSEKAAGGVVVTSGRFTVDAWRFARENGVELVDGKMLAESISSLRPDKEPGRASFEVNDRRQAILSRSFHELMRRLALRLAVSLVGVLLIGILMLGAWKVLQEQLQGLGTSKTRPPEQAAPLVRAAPQSPAADERVLDGRIYKWRDQSGTVVYGDRPPAEVEAVEVPGRLSEQNVIRSVR